MTELLESDKKKIEILRTLSDGKVYTYYNLSKTIKTNYETVKKNCSFLELLNLIEVNKVDREESASGVASYKVRITENGLRVLKNIVKRD
jgi:hypothetical protein